MDKHSSLLPHSLVKKLKCCYNSRGTVVFYALAVIFVTSSLVLANTLD
jgi:hypothetical protein